MHLTKRIAQSQEPLERPYIVQLTLGIGGKAVDAERLELPTSRINTKFVTFGGGLGVPRNPRRIQIFLIGLSTGRGLPSSP
jgi:hypothetical protein